MRNLVVFALILLLAGLVGGGFTFAGSDLSFGLKEVDIRKEIPAAGIARLKVEFGSMDVALVKGKADVIEAAATGKANGKALKKIRVELVKEGDTAILKSDADTGFTMGLNIVNVNLEISLPERQYDSIIVDSGSGDISFEGLKASVLELDNGSGNVEISEVEADGAKIKTSSGNLSIEESRMNELETTVGSGNIRLTDVEGAIRAKTSSGNIRVELDALMHPLEARSGSGNVTIQTKKAPESAAVSYSTGSGTFRIDWGGGEKKGDADTDTIVFGNGEIPVRLSAGSGNISLKQR